MQLGIHHCVSGGSYLHVNPDIHKSNLFQVTFYEDGVTDQKQLWQAHMILDTILNYTLIWLIVRVTSGK